MWPPFASHSSSRCQRRFRIQRQGHCNRTSYHRKRSTHQTSTIDEDWPASMSIGTDCCVTVDIRVCSLSLDTFLYPVTLPWVMPTVQPKACKDPLLWCNCNRTPSTCYSSWQKRSRCPRVHRYKRNPPSLNPRAVARLTATSCEGDEPGTFQVNPWSKTLNTSHAVPGSSLASPLPLSTSPRHPQEVLRRTREFQNASGHSTRCWAKTQ